MKARFRWACRCLCVGGLLSDPWAVIAAGKQDLRDELFAGGTIPRIQIQLDDAAMSSLRRDSHGYVRATVREGSIVYKDVGLHLKGGEGSFQPLEKKPAMTLNFDKFVQDQKFHGLDKLYLNNALQDPSYLHEYVGSQLFLRAGVPAARVTHARVELNGRDLGLYVLVEGYDKSFLKRHFQNARGNLYDPGGFQDLGEVRERTTGEGPLDYADLKALAAAAQEKQPGVRLERLGRTLDLDRFYTFMGLEVLAGSCDGYTLHRNNYRLYGEPPNGRVTFIPCGLDQLFIEPRAAVLPDTGGMVAAAVLYAAEGRAGYWSRCENLLTNLLSPAGLSNLVAAAQARLAPVMGEMGSDEAARQASAASALQRRIGERLAYLHQALLTPAQRIAFTQSGTAALTNWLATVDFGPALLEAVDSPAGTLQIRFTGRNFPAVASWRTRVRVPPGKYRFAALVRAEGFTPMKNAPRGGVCLRVFGAGSSRETTIKSEAGWQELTCWIEAADSSVLDLLVEARGYSGAVLARNMALVKQ